MEHIILQTLTRAAEIGIVLNIVLVFILLLVITVVIVQFSAQAKQESNHVKQLEMLKVAHDKISHLDSALQKLQQRYNLTEITQHKLLVMLTALEKNAHHTKPVPSSQESKSEEVNYQSAIKQLQAGKDMDVVAKQWNLSGGEAEVLLALQAKNKVRN